MKSDRLLSTLLLLQAHRRLTGRELARRLEVSPRTVHRDMESLSAAGVPVLALRGSRGGWELEEGWRTRVPGLDEAELRALLMAQPRVLGDAGLARAAERALDKLMASLPPSLREQATSIRQRVHVDTTGWGRVPEDLTRLGVVQDAVSLDRKLSIRYRAPRHDEVERVVDPLGLVAKGATWYLVANTSEGLRTYRVSRIEDAKVLDQASIRPAGFDLAAYWQSATAELQKAWTRYEATLRLDPSAARDFRSWRMLTEKPKAGEWVAMRAQFDDEDQACFIVLGLGARADVIEPEGLRERVASQRTAAYERLRAGSSRERRPRVKR